MNIGKWARRVRFTGGVSRANRPLTTPTSRAHLVESEIADRLVMHCGREMHTKREQPSSSRTASLRMPASGARARGRWWCEPA